MNYSIFFIFILCIFKKCFSTICQQNEIYSVVAQSCLKCSSQCQSCYNVDDTACIGCNNNLFVSSNNISTCVQKCQKDEFLNEKLECMKCQVYGCKKCDLNQICLVCDQNLDLDSVNNQCKLSENVCPFQKSLILGQSNLKQCQQECAPTFYQNMKAQICEETVKCIQIEESQRFTYDARIQQIQQVNQNQYLIAGNGCSFALVDDNWEVINKQLLKNPNLIDPYVFQGSENYRHSFIVGDQGGCVADSKIVVMSFKTLEIVFSSNLTYDYYVTYLDQKNQLVFLISAYTDIQMWYDVAKNSLNQQKISFYANRIVFGFKSNNNNNTSFILQTSDLLLQRADMNEDRQMQFRKINSTNLDNHMFRRMYQKNDYFILISFNKTYYITVSKIKIEQDLISLLSIIQVYAHSSFGLYIYFSEIFNSIIQLNTKNLNLEMLVLDESSEKIAQNLNLTSSKINNFELQQDKTQNSAFVMIFSDTFQIMNLTNYFELYNQGKISNYINRIEPQNFTFITKSSIMSSVIFRSDLQIVDVFFSQIFSTYYVYQQQIRLRYNLTDNKSQIKYLNPFQFETLYYDDYSNINQKQVVVTQISDSKSSFFHIFDGYQTFINQTMGFLSIKQFIYNYQKAPRINTQIINLDDQTNKIEQKYSFIRQISNQYILLEQNVNSIIYDYIYDIYSKKLILSYNYKYNYEETKFIYIENKNLLIVKNIPQIFDLNKSQKLITDDQKQFFSLQNFVIINDNAIIYQSLNTKSELILYILDFTSFQSNQIFNFYSSKMKTIWKYDSTSSYPVIFDQDIIYFCDISSLPICQPFSLSQQSFILNRIQLKLFPIQNPSTTYLKTKEIFLFYNDVILACSWDLQNQTQINLGVQYPSNQVLQQISIYQNERFVFYFDLTYFYKFDMDLKKIQILQAQTLSDNGLKGQINFYKIGNTSCLKKSGNIIDTDNMILLKIIEENTTFVGQISTDDAQLHIFSSQNGLYWYQNLLNTPFQIVNFTSSQILQDMYFANGLNFVALYDSNCQCIQIYDLYKSLQQLKQITFNINFDLKLTLVDWLNCSFIYVRQSIFYLVDPTTNNSNQQIAQLDSIVTEYLYCFSSQIIVAKTINQSLYIIRIQGKVVTKVKATSMYQNGRAILYLQFTLQCADNLLIIYSPYVRIINLLDGLSSPPFAQFNTQSNANYQQNIPIVNLKENIVICFFETMINYFKRNDQAKYLGYYEYRQSNTNIYYDIANNSLISATGILKKIYVVKQPGNEQKFTYYTINQFFKEATYFYEDQTTLIIVDTTPIIYLCNYFSGNTLTFNTFITDTQGIQMDKNRNVVFFYSYKFITAFQYPNMQLLEMFSLQQYNQSNILNIYFNQLLSMLIVQTKTAFIAFDLTEVLYTSETSLLLYQNVQSIFLNDEYQVYYSLSNLSLNLFKNAKIVDSFLFEQFKQNIYPYITEPIKISQYQFIFITFDFLNIIQANLINNSLEQVQKIKLQNTPDNFLYDSKQNQIFLLYQSSLQLNIINFQVNDISETFITNFQEGDMSEAFICSNYIIIPSSNYFQIFNIVSKKIDKVNFPDSGFIQLTLKLQIKQQNNLSNWWQIPFENKKRFNTDDWIQQDLFTKNILLLQKQQQGSTLLIFDLVTQQFIYTQYFKDWKIMNIIDNPFKEMIYIVSNQGTTHIFDYSLKFITQIQNSCLKQAKISYDQNFLYSICPNDIIIYNGLSFEQQFPRISKGIIEAYNLININYNNHIIVIQKNKLSFIKLKYNQQHELVYEYEIKNAFIQSFQLITDSNNQPYASILVSSQKNINKIQLPLSQNKLCSIQIQQQNRLSENIFSISKLSQLTQSLQTTKQILSLVEIEYLEGQSIELTEFQVENQNTDPQHKLNLSLFSKYQNQIFQSKNFKFSQQIHNFSIKYMSLSLQNQIDINLDGKMQNFHMLNISLRLSDQLSFSNFNKVYLQQLTLTADGKSQIIISNCQLVVIDQLFLKNILMHEQVLIILQNNVQVIINEIYISDSIQSSLFQISQSESITISNINITNCSKLNSIFEISQNSHLVIANTFIYQSYFSTIYNVKGTTVSDIQKIKIQQCTDNLIFSIKEQEIKAVQYLSEQVILKEVDLFDDVDVTFFFKTSTFELSNLSINHLNISQTVFEIEAIKIGITSVNITNASQLTDNLDVYLINIVSFTDSYIDNIISNNSETSIISINQQDKQGQAIISSSKFNNFSIFYDNPLILLNNLQSIQLKDIETKSVTNVNNKYTSILTIKNCHTVHISDSKFINNTNLYGAGGIIYAQENKIITIENSNFSLNSCKQQNGGALYVINTIQQGLLKINFTQFIENSSRYSSGGSIYLQNSNLVMSNSIFSSNYAQIGGGIYYSQIMPDFLFDLKNGIKNNNTFINNTAQIYGQNFGSTLRKLFIDLQSVKLPQDSVKEIFENSIQIKQFKSGDSIFFQKIQLLDEEDNPIKFIDVNSTQFYSLSSDVQSQLQQISISVSCDQANQQIQCLGQIQTKQFINGGFILEVQIFYKPISNMDLKLVSNAFPSIKDSQGNVAVIAGQVEFKIQIFLDQCSLGQISKPYGNSITCESCPDGKYSLNLSDQECKQCPDSALSCIGSSIQLKNGYWRENELTDNILYCSFNPLSCQPELQTSKFYCDKGYKGPVCFECDVYGEIWGERYSQIYSPGQCLQCEGNTYKIIIYNLSIFLMIFFYIFFLLKRIINKLETKVTGYFLNKLDIIYLGSTLNQSDRQQIISKILTDHLQIMSLVTMFTFKIPIAFTIPLKLFGNSFSMTNKSIDCIFAKYPELQPLWLFQSLWSLFLPIGISVLYLLIGIIFRCFKRTIFIRYLHTAGVFIYFYFFPMIINHASRSLNCVDIGQKRYLDLDFGVTCFDQKSHKPQIFYYSLPLLFVWGIVIPLLLFYKVYNAKHKQKSIFVKMKYSFLFAGYREQYYYWEFWKLFYKASLILLSILLNQNLYLKVAFMNLALIFQFYILFKTKPFVREYFNTLQQQSTLICAISLNLCVIQVITDKNNIFYQDFWLFITIVLNFLFIAILVIGLSRITIQNKKIKMSCFHKVVIKISKKYPQLLDIQVQNDKKFISMVRLKKLRDKIMLLLKNQKRYDFYSQEIYQPNQSQKKKQDFTLAINSPQSIFSSESVDEKSLIFKNKNSIRNLRNKWPYYSRNVKSNQTALKGQSSEQQSIFNDYLKEDIVDTENSAQNNKMSNSFNKIQIELTKEKN